MERPSATCVSLYVRQFCPAGGLAPAGPRVAVTQVGAQNPNRIGECAVRVEAPEGAPDQYLPVRERVAKRCPAHNTLAHGAEVRVEVALPVSDASRIPNALSGVRTRIGPWRLRAARLDVAVEPRLRRSKVMRFDGGRSPGRRRR